MGWWSGGGWRGEREEGGGGFCHLKYAKGLQARNDKMAPQTKGRFLHSSHPLTTPATSPFPFVSSSNERTRLPKTKSEIPLARTISLSPSQHRGIIDATKRNHRGLITQKPFHHSSLILFYFPWIIFWFEYIIRKNKIMIRKGIIKSGNP